MSDDRSLFGGPMPPDEEFENYVRARMASEGVTELAEVEEGDPIEFAKTYGTCACGAPLRPQMRVSLTGHGLYWDMSVICLDAQRGAHAPIFLSSGPAGLA